VYVTWKERGKTVSLYVPRKLEIDVRRWVKNYRKLKELIREVSDIQKQIIRLREDKP
jgi:5-formyltetrahydrofolate cyclo-ligase